MTRQFSTRLPMSVIEGGCDGDLDVIFEWTPGTPATGLSGPPENYDPGEGDGFDLTRTCYVIERPTHPDGPLLVGCDLAEHEQENVIEWLNENWDRPEAQELAEVEA